MGAPATRKPYRAQTALYALPPIGIVATALLSCAVLRWTGFVPIEIGKYLGPKLSFLSVLMALGMFQYKYFRDEMREFTERVEQEKLGPIWSAKAERFQEVADKLKSRQTLLGEAARRNDLTSLPLIREQEAAARNEFVGLADWFKQVDLRLAKVLEEVLLDFGARLALIFMVGAMTLFSVILDLAGISWPQYRTPFFVVWAHISMLYAVVGFGSLIGFFAYVVHANISEHRQMIDNLRTKSRPYPKPR